MESAAPLPGLRKCAGRGGGTGLPPFSLQHLPLCAHHQQGNKSEVSEAERSG